MRKELMTEKFMVPFLVAGVISLQSVVGWANSVDTPLAPDANTVSLWNFDTDSVVGGVDTVMDMASQPLDGTAFNAPLVTGAMPGLTNFGKARQFTGANSFIDFGVTAGSKLDMAGKTTASVEAYIELFTGWIKSRPGPDWLPVGNSHSWGV